MSNKKAPLVTVIILTYNANKLISLCIDALIKQKFSDYKIIIVDNGSDDTCDIVKNYPTVTLFHQNDVQSSYAARNIGIKNTGSELLALIFTRSKKNNYTKYLTC